MRPSFSPTTTPLSPAEASENEGRNGDFVNVTPSDAREEGDRLARLKL